MSLKPRHFAVAAIAAVLLALPTLAGAAKLPTYYRYGAKCNKAKICTQSGYTNSKNSQIVSFYIGLKCTNGSTNSIELLNPTKINSKRKFSFEANINTAPADGSDTVYGKATISGKSKKKDKITGKWSIDNVAAGCENIKTGSFSLKYKGSQKGG